MLNIILIVVIAICLTIIGFIVARKIPRVSTLDLNTVAEARAQKIKDKLLYDRLQRQTEKSGQWLSQFFLPLGGSVKKIFAGLFQKVTELEKRYQREAKQTHLDLNPGTLEQRIREIVSEAEELARKEQFVEAEKKFIEAVSLAPKNIKVYKGLLDVYLKQKEYKEALQISLHVVKLETKNAVITEKDMDNWGKVKVYSNATELSADYLAVGEVCALLGKSLDALKQYELALEYEPRSPRNLDRAIAAAIAAGEKIKAFDLMKQLEEVNPENQKLREYYEEIAGM